MWNTKNTLRQTKAFSLIELLLGILLVSLLAALVMPTLDTARERSESVLCASNLRQIGLAALQKIQDNNNTVPRVESDPRNPVYAPEDGALSLADTLRPYGITDRTLRCPSDARKHNYFGQKGTSYQWFPVIDGEVVLGAEIYTPGGILVPPLTLIPVAADFKSVHRGKQNLLFADGHVQAR